MAMETGEALIVLLIVLGSVALIAAIYVIFQSPSKLGVECPHCRGRTPRAGFPIWAIVVSILFFPWGLLALVLGRQPTQCKHCGLVFHT